MSENLRANYRTWSLEECIRRAKSYFINYFYVPVNEELYLLRKNQRNSGSIVLITISKRKD
jgi:hypothetical protein